MKVLLVLKKTTQSAEDTARLAVRGKLVNTVLQNDRILSILYVRVQQGFCTRTPSRSSRKIERYREVALVVMP